MELISMGNTEITIGIKTFFRYKKLRKCLQSLTNKGFYEIIIADHGIISEKKQAVYDEYSKKLPIKLIDVEFDKGVGYITKLISEEFKTPYLFIIDDDMEVLNIDPLKEILKENRNIGAVTGQLLENGILILNAGNFSQKGRILFLDKSKSITDNLKYTKNGIPYFINEYIRYPLLLRRECIKDYNWDDRFLIGFEHEDFFLTHKHLGRWNFAATPSVLVIHNPGGDYHYRSYRYGEGRREDSRDQFLKKYNLKAIIYVEEDRHLLTNFKYLAYPLDIQVGKKIVGSFQKIIQKIINFPQKYLRN